MFPSHLPCLPTAWAGRVPTHPVNVRSAHGTIALLGVLQEVNDEKT